MVTGRKIKAWHFIGKNRRMSRTGRKIEEGKTYSVQGEIAMCHHGLHASEKLEDALRYADMAVADDGTVLCRVTLSGRIEVSSSKLVAQRRTVHQMRNVTDFMNDFAFWCARRAMKLRMRGNRPLMKAAIAAKRRWLCNKSNDNANRLECACDRLSSGTPLEQYVGLCCCCFSAHSSAYNAISASYDLPTSVHREICKRLHRGIAKLFRLKHVS